MSWPPVFHDLDERAMPFPIPVFLSDDSGNATPLPDPQAGILCTDIAAGTSTATTIKTGAGVFYGVGINSVGVGAPQIFDNTSASGKVLCSLLASAPLGLQQVVPAMGVQFATGLTVAGSATNPAMVIFYK